MAVSGYNIAAIKAEFPQHAHMNDLGSLGAAIIGRPFGQAIWISEFYGRSNILTYYPTFPAYPTYSTNEYSFGTAHGMAYFDASSHEFQGTNSQYLNVSKTVAYNPTAWAKLIDVHIPWMGYTWSKATLEANNYGVSWPGGNFSGGSMTWRFYG